MSFGIANNAQSKEAPPQQSEQELLSEFMALMQNERLRSNAIMTNYNNYATNNGYSFYAQGGVPPQGQLPPYEAEKGEVIQGQGVQVEGEQIASDVHAVGGNTHGQGGTIAQGGEMVFSDRIVIGADMSGLLKQAGYNFKDKQTYAEVAMQLGKTKGAYEKASMNADKVTGQTGKLMTSKVDTLLQILFMGQEQYKGSDTQMAYGGRPYKMADGGVPYSGKKVTYTMGNKYQPIYNPYEIPKAINTNLTNRSNIAGVNRTGNIPYSSPNSVATTILSDDVVSATPDKEIASMTLRGGETFEQIAPYLQVAAGALQNRAYINRMKTKVPTQLLSNPAYTYNDRSQGAIRDVERDTNQLMTGLDRSGASAASKAAVYGKSLEAKSAIRANENQRLDAYNTE